MVEGDRKVGGAVGDELLLFGQDMLVTVDRMAGSFRASICHPPFT
jgi:hypothetical protein